LRGRWKRVSNSLDLATLGRCRPEPNATGQPMYDPKDVLKLYMYGYMSRTHPSRRLELGSGRSLEAFWPPGELYQSSGGGTERC
jgi:transposase